eukprot:16429-Heterococcus_DN1.PRE.3
MLDAARWKCHCQMVNALELSLASANYIRNSSVRVSNSIGCVSTQRPRQHTDLHFSTACTWHLPAFLHYCDTAACTEVC